MSEVRWVPLAEVARPHGVWGEVRLKVYNGDSDLLFGQAEVLVRRSDAKESMMQLESLRGANSGFMLAKFRGVDGRDAADRLRGASICVERQRFPPLEDGECYVCDSIGARLVGPSGDIGVVENFMSYPTADVLLVKLEGAANAVEIPLLEDFVERVDSPAGRVVLGSEGVEWLERTVAEKTGRAD